jgi:hypothetical protein
MPLQQCCKSILIDLQTNLGWSVFQKLLCKEQYPVRMSPNIYPEIASRSEFYESILAIFYSWILGAIT